MTTKNILIGIIGLVLVGGISWYASSKNTSPMEETVLPGGRVGSPTAEEQTPPGDLKTTRFSGKLEEVNVGCFVDGECFVVVSGKHVTTTLGWRQEVVGSVLGVEGFGDLEGHIGEDMEIYAQDKGDGTYTLYGSESFYVKLK